MSDAMKPDNREPDYKAAMLYHSDRADGYMAERDAQAAELTRLRAKVEAADKLAEVLRRADNAICNCDGPHCFSCQRERLAIDAALSAYEGAKG